MERAPEDFNPAVLYELTSTAIQGLLYPFGLKPRNLKKDLGPGRTRPVVLIHGYGGNRSGFLPLELCLRLVGFDRVFPFNFDSLTTMESAAFSLQAYIEELRKNCQQKKNTVDLVAYSMGGLVARVYLQELGGARHVDQCITIATPHYGTYSSYWTPTSVGRQMRPESEFMARINAPQKRASGVRFLSLWAGQDILVLPRENAIYKEGNDLCVENIGHWGILLHRKTLVTVTEKLRAGQQLPATPVERAYGLTKLTLQKSLALFSRIKASSPPQS